MAPPRSYVSQTTRTARHDAHKALMATDKPHELTSWGLDDELWDSLPTGAIRDLKRFIRTGKNELAKCRIETVTEISQYRRGSITDEKTWFEASKAWGFGNKVKAIEAKEKAKARRKSRSKGEAEAKVASAQ